MSEQIGGIFLAVALILAPFVSAFITFCVIGELKTRKTKEALFAFIGNLLGYACIILAYIGIDTLGYLFIILAYASAGGSFVLATSSSAIKINSED